MQDTNDRPRWLELTASRGLRCDLVEVRVGPPAYLETPIGLDAPPGYTVLFPAPGGAHCAHVHIAATTMLEAVELMEQRWPLPAWWSGIGD